MEGSKLNIAIKAALNAGREILKVYNRDFKIDYKEDESPLTEADIIANNVILSYLKKTGIPIISEETKQLDYSIRKIWTSCWLVDPLDGTKEFIKKNGEFTVNIALIENGVTRFGVIYTPVLNELYYTNENKSIAYKLSNVNSEKFEARLFDIADIISPCQHSKENIKIIGSRSHLNNDTNVFIDSLKEDYDNVEFISKGSSLKFCLVAEGKAHLYPRFAPTMEWDTAAGQAICEAAGIDVIDIETGRSMIYNKENLLNNYFLASKEIANKS